MKTLDEMIAVMQAARDGKNIELFDVNANVWKYVIPTWNWSVYDYRVKPEPRRWKIHIHPVSPNAVSICFTPEACEREGYEVVDVVEVMR